MGGSYEYYSSQARLIGAAGVMLRDGHGRILLLKPTYKRVWHLPGGIMEPNESPREAACREVHEETSLEVTVGLLLAVDFKTCTADRPAGIQFVFDGGALSAEQTGRISIAAEEVSEFGFFPASEAVTLVGPGGPSARMVNALKALENMTTVYLEDGEPARPSDAHGGQPGHFVA